MFSGGREMEHWLEIGEGNILNNSMNGSLIFICSYPLAELYSTGLQYAVNGTWRDCHANHYTNNNLKFECLPLNVNKCFGFNSHPRHTATILNRLILELYSWVTTDKD